MIALLPLPFGQMHFLYYLIVIWLKRSALEISKWEEITRAHGLISSRDGKKKKRLKTVTTKTTTVAAAAPRVMMQMANETEMTAKKITHFAVWCSLLRSF